MKHLHRSTLRVLLVLAVIGLSGWTLHRNYQTCVEDRARAAMDRACSPVKLGLDLQGGMHLVLEVDDPGGTMSGRARAEAVDRAIPVIRSRIDHLGVQERLIRKSGDERIIVELPGIVDTERAKGIIGQMAFLQFFLVQSGREHQLFADRLARADRVAAARLLDSGRDGRFLVREADVAAVRAWLASEEAERTIGRGVALRWDRAASAWGEDTFRALWVLGERAFLTGGDVVMARPGRDPEFHDVMVSFDLSRGGGRTFERVTGENLGELIAIVLDDAVISAPVIETRIGSSGRIRMHGATLEEARDLALMLRAGALPAPLRILEERTIEASLGADSVRQGWRAAVIGIVAVALAMVAYYRTAGALAIAALLIYALLVLGGLAAVDATLTLPGLAGLVLSLGMAVDANVLVFERIREELRHGRSARSAVDRGFRRAMGAIIDSNLTTLLTALVLRQVGTGPVQGFAVTLAIGIVASFFSAVFVTRTLFLLHPVERRSGEVIRI